jgi:hypothetical protein
MRFASQLNCIRISMEKIQSKWERFDDSTSLMSYVLTRKAKEDLASLLRERWLPSDPNQA